MFVEQFPKSASMKLRLVSSLINYINTAALTLLVFLLSLSGAYGHECNVESVFDHNLMHVVNGVLSFMMLGKILRSVIY